MPTDTSIALDTATAERELGYVAAQWQDTDNHTPERTRRFALRAAVAAVCGKDIAPATRQAAMYFRVGELTAQEFITVVLNHVYGRTN